MTQTQQSKIVEKKRDPSLISTTSAVDLASYTVGDFDRGRSIFVELLWMVVQALLVSSWLPGTPHRRLILRTFGAKLGHGVVIKPGLRVKFPWRLRIGDHSWIGESVWIDNLADVEIGSNCCISQGVYLCTGSHDWKSREFGLIVKPIAIADMAWIAAKAIVGPGVVVGTGAVLSLGGAAFHDLEPWTIHQGVPAVAIRKRELLAH
jgi:putative colanic acid biosynthesis acetyltransferase WcaF